MEHGWLVVRRLARFCYQMLLSCQGHFALIRVVGGGLGTYLMYGKHISTAN
jgi:hypothetical protein